MTAQSDLLVSGSVARRSVDVDRMLRFAGRCAHRGLITILILFLIAPLLAVVYLSFSSTSFFQFPPKGFSLHWFSVLWHTPLLIHALERSAAIAAVVVVLTGIFAFLAAFALDRARFRGKALVDTFFQSPLIVPELIFGIALLKVYAPMGLEGTYPGIVAAHVVIAFPYFLRSVYVGLELRDRTIEEMATVLGASRPRVFTSITLPMIKGAVASGAIFAFIASFDQFSVSLFVTNSQTQTLPVAIYNQLFANNDPTTAAVSTVVILIGLLAAIVVNSTVGLDRLLVTGRAAESGR